MSITAERPGGVAQYPPPDVFQLSVAQYHRMIDANILDEGDPVELLDGCLVHKWPDYPPHRYAPEDIFRLSLPQYHRMIEEGILDEDDPVELLDGCLIKKMSKNPPHSGSNELVQEELRRRLPVGYYLRTQEPISLAVSEPEPDACVIRGRVREFMQRHPGPADVALVLEVSNISLPRDRNWKQSLYAAAGIPVYWIVNLSGRAVEVYSVPTGTLDSAAYSSSRIFKDGDSVPLILDGREVASIPVRDVLP